jgi:hypothetical protein
MQRIFQVIAWLLGRGNGRPVTQPAVRSPSDRRRTWPRALATATAFAFGYLRRAGILLIALPAFAAAIEIA